MPNHKKIDKTDVKILELLQQDSRITTAQLSEELSLSTSPCWRRVKQLEDTKIIKGYGVLLDRKKINLGVMVFIRVSIDSHSEKEAKKFEEEVTALDMSLHVTALEVMQISYFKLYPQILILMLNSLCQ